jgi:hypothetical protein
LGSASEIQRTELPVGAFLLVTASLPAKKHKPCGANQTLSEWMRKYWTVADIAFEHWTFADVALNIGINITKTPLRTQTESQLFAATAAAPAVVQRLRQLESAVRKRPVFRSVRDHHRWRRNGTGFASLFASPADA